MTCVTRTGIRFWKYALGKAHHVLEDRAQELPGLLGIAIRQQGFHLMSALPPKADLD